ncbi:death domain-containing protein CRADD [Lepisosteus oculatus]|uniref:CASP2 and RIPK1 domain containing adaptor with death domain n=1 Tax=Lepisosteus oculatus TaxID=7918 RepID=W5NFK7_LEPOC|nr:PREDICTED: death domain-containing protein CRADD [Lepisosteus oculatus]
MDRRHKQFLREHRLELSNQLVLIDTTIVQYLYQENILTESHVEEIRSRITNKQKTLALLEILPTRGPRAFETFLESLKEEFPWVREKLLQDLENATSEVNSTEPLLQISEEMLNSVPSDKQLNKLVGRLGPEWETLLLDLGLSSNDIYRCKANHCLNVQSQALAAFVLWKQKFGKRATVRCLHNSLLTAEIDTSVVDDIFQ